MTEHSQGIKVFGKVTEQDTKFGIFLGKLELSVSDKEHSDNTVKIPSYQPPKGWLSLLKKEGANSIELDR